MLIDYRSLQEVAWPTILSVNYAQGDPLGGGQSIVITGTGLSGATSVNFGTASATILSNTSQRIVVTLPANAAGFCNLTVTTSTGTSSPFSFEYWSPTSISTDTQFVDGDYTGAPWVAQTGPNLTSAGADPAASGGAAVFAGNQLLHLASTATGMTTNSGTGNSKGTFVCVMKATAAGTHTANSLNNPGVVSVFGGNAFNISFDNQGFTCTIFDSGVSALVEAHSAMPADSAYHIGFARFSDNVEISCRTDGGGWQPNTAFQTFNVQDSGLVLGWDSAGTNKLNNASIAALFFLNVSISNAIADKTHLWAQQRYGVSATPSVVADATASATFSTPLSTISAAIQVASLADFPVATTTGAASISSVASVASAASFTPSGAGELDAVLSAVTGESASIQGTGALAAIVSGTSGVSASPQGAGAPSATIAATASESASIHGAGAISDAIAAVGATSFAATGTGSINDTMAAVTGQIASIAGSGAPSDSAAAVAGFSAAPQGAAAISNTDNAAGATVFTLTGTGAIVSTLAAAAAVSLAIQGAGALSTTSSGIAGLSATGTLSSGGGAISATIDASGATSFSEFGAGELDAMLAASSGASLSTQGAAPLSVGFDSIGQVSLVTTGALACGFVTSSIAALSATGTASFVAPVPEGDLSVVVLSTTGYVVTFDNSGSVVIDESMATVKKLDS